MSLYKNKLQKYEISNIMQDLDTDKTFIFLLHHCWLLQNHEKFFSF